MMSLSVYFNLILIFYHKIEIKEYVKSGAATFSGESGSASSIWLFF